ncbi:tigger transposable element-derived protein 6-like [Dermacentor andersoni]|uniref:tigger transposable element-derived protein 6-like n=1 Tax=Dermacentor andersoni TaxID=34620 RepID=UPI003B3B8A94
MTREVVAGWLRDWDEKLKRQNRKICLFLDNCGAHHTIAALTNIELRFLPPNFMAVIEPLDDGVLMSFKAGYRKRVIYRLVLNIQLNRDTKADLYMAIEVLNAAWMHVAASTIASCFRRASFAAHESNPDTDDSMDRIALPSGAAVSDEALASWRVLHDAGVMCEGETFCDYVSVDADVLATEELTDDDFVLAAREHEGSDNEGAAEDNDTPPYAYDVPTSSQALDAVDLLRRHFGGHEDGADGLEIAAAAEKAVLRLRKTQQRSITDYFAPST